MSEVITQASIDKSTKRLKSKSKNIYYLYMIGLVIGLTALIGIILAYINKGRSDQYWLESHFKFQVKTFWYGVVYLGLALLLSPVIVGFFIWIFWVIWTVKRCLVGLSALKEEVAVEGGFFSFGKKVD